MFKDLKTVSCPLVAKQEANSNATDAHAAQFLMILVRRRF